MALKNQLRNPKRPIGVVGAKVTAVRMVSFNIMFPCLPLFRLAETNVNSSDFSFYSCFRIVFSFFKIWFEIVPLWLKLCLLRYRENNIGTKVTLSSVNKVRYIKIGRNKNEIFSSPAFPCSANLKSRTRMTIVNAKGILLFIPKRKFFGACEAQVKWWKAK